MKFNIKEIIRLLNKAYGLPKPFRKTAPVDELVRTILSQNTNDRNSLAAFAILKKNFKSWNEILNTPVSKIARLIKHAGLANIKAGRIKNVLAEIKRREGKISLSSLSRLDTDGALEYLKSLEGVGPKTAACVLLFSFGKPVMPVDTHIFRVTKRLALIDSDLSIEEAHEVLTKMFHKMQIPRRGLLRKPCSGSRPEFKTTALIYMFHLSIIEHGRRACRAQNPDCGICALYNLCKFPKKKMFKRRDRT